MMLSQLESLVITGAAQALLLGVVILLVLRLRRDVVSLAEEGQYLLARSREDSIPPRKTEEDPSQPTMDVDADGRAETGGEERGSVHFVVDALLLAQLYRYLRHPEVESFAYVAGHELGQGRYALSHLVPVGLARQSACGAQADADSSVQALGALSDWGAVLTGHAHTHPGHGPGSIFPSGTDRRLVAALAAGGYTAIGFIFSQDGYVRAYTGRDEPFVVEIHGKNIEEVGEYVWRLDPSLADGPLPVSVPAVPGRSQSTPRCVVRV